MPTHPKPFFDYQSAEFETVACNLCGGGGERVVSRYDRYGLKQQSVICTRCGLIFLNPRLTPEWYGKFYEESYSRYLGAQRKQREPELNFEKIFSASVRFGAFVAKRVRGFLGPGFTLEVGSSLGGVLAGFQKELGVAPVLGIEPSRPEAEFARSRGIPTEATLFEHFEARSWAPRNILCVQSLNHLLDPRGFLSRAHAMLGPGGRLVLVVQNFRSLAEKLGVIARATQIDHTFMFVPETLALFVEAAGFDTLFFEDWRGGDVGAPSTHHMCLVAKKAARQPFGRIFIPPGTFAAVSGPLWRIRRRQPLVLAKRGFRRFRKVLRHAILRQPKKSYERF